MRGRRTTLHLTLTPEEQSHLLKLTRATVHVSAAHVRRATLVLLVAEGRYAVATIAERCQMSRRSVYQWIARFQAHRLAGLRVKPPTGGRRAKQVA
jgi:hypothetical protein